MQTQNTPKVQGTWLRKGVRDCKRQRESDALLSMVSPNNIRSYTYKFEEHHHQIREWTKGILMNMSNCTGKVHDISTMHNALQAIVQSWDLRGKGTPINSLVPHGQLWMHYINYIIWSQYALFDNIDMC